MVMFNVLTKHTVEFEIDQVKDLDQCYGHHRRTKIVSSNGLGLMTRVTAVLLTHLVEAELQHLLSCQPRVLAEQELLLLALNLEGCGHRDSGA
jgi:hypothetical protein